MIKRIYSRIYYEADRFLPPAIVRKGGEKIALICYIRNPFRKNANIFHSNVIEAILIADSLCELGYTVKVVDYRYKGKINYSAYNLIIGFGEPFRNSFGYYENKIRHVSYLTGANPSFSNYAEALRLKKFRLRNGVLLQPQREVYWPWVFGVINSHSVIVVGNEWTASTYNGYNDNIFTVPVPFVCEPELLKMEVDAKKHFVYFAGNGGVHKGLDLLIEAFIKNEADCFLHICCNIKREKDLLSCYDHRYGSNKNRIIIHGMIDPYSDNMRQICMASAFVILPSCSEGTASSVITCMAKGLIPVVTKESGIVINDFGIQIKEGTVDSVCEAVSEALQLTEENIITKRASVYEYVYLNHSADKFKNRVKESLKGV